MNDEPSVYEERGLLEFAPAAVQTLPDPPSHPGLHGVYGFCSTCATRPAIERCPECPVAAAERAEDRALLARSSTCPTCGQSVTRRQRRRAKEKP
jgi:hypothetical protein